MQLIMGLRALRRPIHVLRLIQVHSFFVFSNSFSLNLSYRFTVFFLSAESRGRLSNGYGESWCKFTLLSPMFLRPGLMYLDGISTQMPCCWRGSLTPVCSPFVAESRHQRTTAHDSSPDSQRRSVTSSHRSPSPVNGNNTTATSNPYGRGSSVANFRQSISSSAGLVGLSNLGNTVSSPPPFFHVYIPIIKRS